MDALKNFSYSNVATAPSPATSGTSLVVTAGQGSYFPATPFDATIWPAGSQPTNTNAEIVRVTNVSTDTFTITRAQYGTTAQTITAGYQIAQTVDANLLSQLAPLSGATFTGEVVVPDLKITGLTGATAGTSRLVGTTTAGPPTTGTFAVGDLVIDQTATIWVCTVAGTPGTWSNIIPNSLVVRSATATAGTGEFTIFGTTGTSGQTITLPANAINGAIYQIKNLSAYTVNILGGTNSISVSGTVYTASTPYTIPLNAAYTFVYSGGVWFCMVTTDINKMGGLPLAVTGGGTGTATAPAIGSIPVATSTSVYSPLAIGANNTVLRSNGTTAAWATDVISFSAGTTGLTPSSATTGAVTLAGTLAVANGGLNATTTAVGSIPLGSSTTAYTPLAIGASGTVLNSNGTTASWLASTGTGNNVLATNPVLTGAVLTSPFETVSTSSTALSGSTAAALNASTSSFFNYTANPTAAFTVNITNAPTTTGQSVTFAMLVNNGATAYLPLNFTVNGNQSGASSSALPAQGATNNGITTYYQGGTAWTAADASTIDSYTFVVICTGSSTWTVLVSQTKF